MKGPRTEAVVIGASAGALEALSKVLPALPENYRLPVIVVVHIPADKRSVLADIFQSKCRVPVREAEDKEPIEAGVIYFAPPDYHLLVESSRSLALSSDEAVLFSRPSIDVLFESAADAYGSGLIAIVLTGANNDGAAGVRKVANSGGRIVVQTPRDAYATAMPQAALAACPEALVLPLSAIAEFLREV